jgi:hypothetical protein
MKLLPGKITAPGPKQVFRGPLTGGDIIGVRGEPVPAGDEPLLVPVMLGGRPTGANGDLAAARARFEDDLSRLPATARASRTPDRHPCASVSGSWAYASASGLDSPTAIGPHGLDWSGWAGRLGGRGRRGCAGEALRLLDELAEPLDGVLVGAKVLALEGLLGASVLLGLLLEDPRQGG